MTQQQTPARASLEITTPSERTIQIRRSFDAPRRLVWAGITRPELLIQWCHGPDRWTLAECDVDARPGGRFRYVWRNREGNEMGMGGVYREVSPPEHMVHTEIFDEDWTGGETLVTTSLAENDGRTDLTIVVEYASKEARDGALESGMEEGMAVSYDRLARLLAELGASDA